MSAPSFLCRNRFGVYYFRMRIPERVRQASSTTRAELRFSLRTKDKRLAIKLAREAYVAAMNKEQFTSPEVSSTIAEGALNALLEIVRRQEEIVRRQEEIVRNQEVKLDTLQKELVLALRNSANAQSTNDERLEALIERFLEHRRSEVSVRTAAAYAHKLDYFRCAVEEIFGRPSLLSEIDADVARKYLDLLSKLPLYSSQKVSCTKKTDETNPISNKTINTHLRTVRTFLLWAEQQGYSVSDKCLPVLKFKRVRPGGRLPFDTSDLRALFEANEFKYGQFNRGSDYWVPLLGLFTGAREAELCQLDATDVYQDRDTGIWIIDINQNNGKKLKSHEINERKIPIHSRLIALGFLDFVARRKKEFETWPARGISLFGFWERRNNLGEFSGFSKRFNRYRQKKGVNGIKGARKDFHSFRHTVTTQLLGKGCPLHIVNSITGHTRTGTGYAASTYWNGRPLLEVAQEWIEKLDYDVEFRRPARRY